jgi:hypothetical protein
MWMQKGMEVERYEKIANPNSIPAANNFNGHGRKSDTELLQQTRHREYSY